MPKTTINRKNEGTEDKYKMTVWVDRSTYFGLHDAKNAHAKKSGKPIRPSNYIESEIFKPFLAKQAKAAGVLK